MFKRIIIMVTMLIALLACSNNNSGGGTNGALAFSQSTYQVTTDGYTEIILSLKGSSSTTGVNATISSSNNNIAVATQSQCVLSDESGFPSSCEVKVKGVSVGSTTITASAAGVAVATATVSVDSAVIPGTLAFTPVSEQATAGSDARVVLSLNGSSGVENLVVEIVSSDPTIANPLHSSCVLSTLERTCTVIVDAEKAGNAVVTASAAGYASATNTINVANDVVTGTLSFDGNKQIQVGNTGFATLSLSGSSGVYGVNVALTTQNADATISPANCILSSARPVCHVTITGVAAGSDNITATASGYTSAGMVASITTVPVNGNLYFETSTESVVVNAYKTIQLLYTGGSGVNNLPVTLSTNNSNVTISPITCTMNNLHGSSHCDIMVSGLAQGKTTITAKAAGYPDAINTVNILPAGNIVYGDLKLLPANSNLLNGASESMLLTLVGSSNVSSLVVNLAATTSGIVTLNQSTCTLSTLNNSCAVSVTGINNGNTLVTASASPITSQATASVTVTPKAETRLVFSPDILILSNQNTTAHTSTLTLVNPPAEGVNISFSGDNSAFMYSPGTCTLTQTTPSCVVNINNKTIGGQPGTYAFTAIPDDSYIANAALPVIIAPSTAIQRTITVINMCRFTVYPGITGAAANLTNETKPGTCPNGTIYSGAIDPTTGYRLCYWKNPLPTTGSYKLSPYESTQFVIPTSNTDSIGTMWGGAITARLKLNESWVIGVCNGGQESVGDSCATGVAFSNPVNTAEFTITPSNVDYYDLSLIGGISIPMTIAPNSVSADGGNPYMNGIAGSTSEQVGSQYTLKASSWSFDPSTSGLVAPTNSVTYYNYVSGVSTSNDQCTADSDCTGSSNGPVCGYANNSLKSLNGLPATYTRVCGYRLAYLTASAIYSINANSSNTAPFNFSAILESDPNLQYPNVNNNPMSDFYQCSGGAAQSGYQPKTTYPNACGCANWATMGIATPTQLCQGTSITSYTPQTQGIGFNSAWLNQVLPRIKWVKKAVPTAYSFQFDDMSSTFQGYKQASNNNAANAVNYTITFCPDGKSIPDYDPNLQ